MIFRKIKELLSLNEVSSNDTTITTNKGKVRYFNRQKGFGFIRTFNTKKDIFVDSYDVNKNISKGDKVKFQIEKNEKGIRAKNVKLL